MVKMSAENDPPDIAREVRRAVEEERWDDLVPLSDAHAQRVALTHPDVWPEAFDAAPDGWLQSHPRQRYMRTVYRAVEGRFSVPNGDELAMFDEWVNEQQHPLPRDMVLVEASRLQYLRLMGRFTEAMALVETMDDLIGMADDYRGFDDVLPSVYIPAGMTRLAAGDLPGAIAAFQAARHWSNVGPVHPADEHAANYLGVALHFAGNHSEARSTQASWAGERRFPPGSYAYVWESASLVLPGLSSLAGLDRPELERAIDQIDDGIDEDELWWVAAHLRARHGLYWGDIAQAVDELQNTLAKKRAVSAGNTLVSDVLTSDLADLLQAQGDLRELPGLADEKEARHPSVVLSRARLRMLRGELPAARSLLAVDSSSGQPLPSAPASWLVLRAAVERLDGGDVAADGFAAAAA
ncbi:MAG: hypothetical protein WA971_02865, partial [Microbacterium sp.]